MKSTGTEMSFVKLWVNRLAFMIYSVRRNISIHNDEKEITTKDPKKRKRQQLVQNVRFYNKVHGSEKGAGMILGINFLIVLFTIIKVLGFNLNFGFLYFLAFAISYGLTIAYLDNNDFYRNKYIYRQMKRPEEDRFRMNMGTFGVFSVIPVIWFVWMICK